MTVLWILFFSILNLLITNLDGAGGSTSTGKTAKTVQEIEQEFVDVYKDAAIAESRLDKLKTEQRNYLCFDVQLESHEVGDKNFNALVEKMVSLDLSQLQNAFIVTMDVYFQSSWFSNPIKTVLVACPMTTVFIRESADSEIGLCYYVLKSSFALRKLYFVYETCMPSNPVKY